MKCIRLIAALVLSSSLATPAVSATASGTFSGTSLGNGDAFDNLPFIGSFNYTTGALLNASTHQFAVTGNVTLIIGGVTYSYAATDFSWAPDPINAAVQLGASSAGNRLVLTFYGLTGTDPTVVPDIQPEPYDRLSFQAFISRQAIGGPTTSYALDAVPEPVTWAMMLLGFGGIGLTMRRRKSTLPQLA